MPVTLSPPQDPDLDALCEFEFSHRAYFERWVNHRPAEYYRRDGVAKAISLAQADAAADRGYQFLARDERGRLVGRVNLHQVRRTHWHAASLGYRVAEDAAGRGIARSMVELVLPIAFDTLGLKRIEATARPDNLASVRVLEANGFRQFGHAKCCMELNGQWFDLLHFERHAPGFGPQD